LNLNYKFKILNSKLAFGKLIVALIFAGILGFAAPASADYQAMGIIQSVNLLQGSNAEIIKSFSYNVDIPANTAAKVQFSQNNSQWYNSAGTLGSYDALSAGEHSIDLFARAWKGQYFYYRMVLTSTNGAVTPSINSISLRYDDLEVGTTVTYYTSGNFVSTNLLSGAGVASVNNFSYSMASLPPNTGATVQFSQDNSNWYDSSGALGASNMLYAGINEIDLSLLGWQGEEFYYKVSFTSDGVYTPEMDYAALSYFIPPVPSNFSPASGSIIITPTPTITFNTDENATCKVSLIDQAYDDMIVACSGAGTTSQSCTAPDLGSDGTKTVYIACQDTSGNKDTADTNTQLTYTLDTTPPVTEAVIVNLNNNITVTLSCDDGAGSGCGATYYCYDIMDACSPTLPYTGPVNFSITENKYFRFYSVDVALNTAATASELVEYTGAAVGGGAGSFVSQPGQQQPGQTQETQTPGTEEISQQDNENIISQMQQQIKNLIGYMSNLLFKPEQEKESEPEIQIPEETPQAFEDIDIIGELSTDGLGIAFVGNEIGFFSEKLPNFSKIISDLGLEDLSALKDLGGAEFVLPNIASLISPEKDGTEQGLAAPTISIANMNQEEKSKIPTDIVFARTAGELIDYNMAISINELGDVEQKISIIAGQEVELVVKPEYAVNRITGLVVLKKSPQANANIYSEFLRYFSAAITGPATSQNLEANGLLLDKFEYSHIGDGVYKAKLKAPVNEGEYEIITIIEYQDKALQPKGIKLIAVVDPEGYVFRKMAQGELRIRDALVSIYWLNQGTGEYELWPARQFFQENPQTTDETGRYVFLVPEGLYYLKAQAQGYYDYESAPFSVVKEIGVHKNIELKKKMTWQDWLDWKIAVMTILVLAIIFIAYKYIKNLISKNAEAKNI